MKIEEWGPIYWYVIHTSSFGYPLNPTQYHKTAYKEFYTSFKDVLPCESCRQHYSSYLSTYPISPHLDSRANLIKYLIQLHNFVNQRLGKQIYTVAEVLSIYKNLKPVSPFSNLPSKDIMFPLKQRKYKIFTFMIILVLLILYMKWYHHRNYFS